MVWGDVDLDKRIVHLPKTKNEFARDVPLFAEAIRVIEQVRSESESVFLICRPVRLMRRSGRRRAGR